MTILEPSEKDRQILVGSQFHADASVTKLSRLLSTTEHVVRYCIQKYTEKRIALFTPVVNIYQLGFLDVGVYFSCAALTKKAKANLLKSLCSDERVLWVAEVGGEFQYGLALQARHMWELENLLKRLSELTRGVIVNKEIAIRTDVNLYRSKYLSPTFLARNGEIGITYKGRQVIDEVDHRILRGLCEIDFYSVAALSQRIGLPESTVDSRLIKLRERGILLGCIYRFDEAAFGYHSFRTIIYEKGASPTFRTALTQFSKQHPNILTLVRSVGSWDYELNIQVKNPREIIDITQELYERFEHSIQTLKTMTVFETHRRTYYAVKKFQEKDSI